MKKQTTASAKPQRARLLCLREIFIKYTDENKHMSRSELEDKMAELGYETGRRALCDDIRALKDFGMDICSTAGRNAKYWLDSRDFEPAELKLLADAVSCSKFLTKEKADKLLTKLGKLCSEEEALQLRRNVYVTGQNKSLIYNVDTINRALNAKKKTKISFKYFSYNEHKQKVYREGLRTCTPYAFVWDNEKYYLIAWNDHRECISNYRVDRMESVKITAEPARPLKRGINMREYISAHFSMFSGEPVEIKLCCDNSIINPFLERFGMDICLSYPDGGHFVVRVKAAASPSFYSWIFQFGDKAEILEPVKIRNEYKELLEKSLGKMEQPAADTFN